MAPNDGRVLEGRPGAWHLGDAVIGRRPWQDFKGQMFIRGGWVAPSPDWRSILH